MISLKSKTCEIKSIGLRTPSSTRKSPSRPRNPPPKPPGRRCRDPCQRNVNHAELEQRLKGRGTESEAVLKRRMDNALAAAQRVDQSLGAARAFREGHDDFNNELMAQSSSAA